MGNAATKKGDAAENGKQTINVQIVMISSIENSVD